MARVASAPRRSEMRDELWATIEARRELGDSYDEHLIEQFLDRLERRQVQRRWVARKDNGAYLLRLFFSLLFALPLTAIAGGAAGWAGILIVWTVLFLLNFRWRG